MQFNIRPVQTGDGAGINLLRRMPGVFESILGIPSERIDFNEKYLEHLDRCNDHNFVAVTTGENGEELIIGNAALGVYANPRARHSGGIGMMVHRDYQGQGVGTALLEALLDIADNWLKLVRVELDVFVDNHDAIHLYKKFGFVEEGVKKSAFIQNGKYVDSMIMGRVRLD